MTDREREDSRTIILKFSLFFMLKLIGNAGIPPVRGGLVLTELAQGLDRGMTKFTDYCRR
jgi:hypothetical protein